MPAASPARPGIASRRAAMRAVLLAACAALAGCGGSADREVITAAKAISAEDRGYFIVYERSLRVSAAFVAEEVWSRPGEFAAPVAEEAARLAREEGDHFRDAKGDFARNFGSSADDYKKEFLKRYIEPSFLDDIVLQRARQNAKRVATDNRAGVAKAEPQYRDDLLRLHARTWAEDVVAAALDAPELQQFRARFETK